MSMGVTLPFGRSRVVKVYPSMMLLRFAAAEGDVARSANARRGNGPVCRSVDVETSVANE